MIKTSYFGNWRNFPKDYVWCNISHFNPRKKDDKLKCFNMFAPPVKLFVNYKLGRLTKEEFENAYLNYLKTDEYVKGKIKRTLVRDKNTNYLLICVEKTGEFCHRHILAKHLKDEYGLDVEEL